MEVGLGDGRADDRDRRREQRVEPAADPDQADVTRRRERRDLAARVDAGVGPRGADHGGRRVEQAGERVLEVALDGRTVGLALPSAQRAAVVLDDQLDRAVRAHRESDTRSLGLAWLPVAHALRITGF